MSASRKPHPIASLSFVSDRAPKSRQNLKRCFWDVQPTGDYFKDCLIGHNLALELLRYEQTSESTGSSNLSRIVGDMPDTRTGVETGFLQTIGYAARFGLFGAMQKLMNEEVALRKLDYGALVNQRPDGSVVIEQPDGTRAVYRKVGVA